MQELGKLLEVKLTYEHGPVYISPADIERMEQAAEAIEMLSRAKEIAQRLARLS